LPSKNEKGLDKPDGNIQPYSVSYVRGNLALADSEHIRATRWAYALGCWLAVLHGDAFSILHFLLGLTFNAIRLHIQASSQNYILTIYYLTCPSQADALSRAKRKAGGVFHRPLQF
jgi:hypothetical protein